MGDTVRRSVSLLASVTLVVGVLVVSASPATAAPAWSIVPSANPTGPQSGFLYGVACATPTSCFGVGSKAGTATYIQRWNGNAWSIVPSPNPPGATTKDFFAIGCASATLCFAVGSYDTGSFESRTAFIERWNGTSWSLIESPSMPQLFLVDVACASATDCSAVGFAGSPSTTVIEHWNGTAWSMVPSPDPAGSTNSSLRGVSCPSSTRCFAVGGAGFPTGSRTLVERWNGASWSIVPSPNPPSGDDIGAFLVHISCPTATSCLALGQDQFAEQPLVERWNASSWSIVARTSISAGSWELAALACAAASTCFAVGYADGQSLIERWNGTSWSSSPSPTPGRLAGVACSSETNCFAVGDPFGDSAPPSLIERWTGGSGWVTVPHPNGSIATGTLNAVRCPTTTTCFGVGFYRRSSIATAPLIEQSGNPSWTVVAVPSPAGAANTELTGIGCPSATSCFAVGWTRRFQAPRQNFIMHWNGSSWAIVPAPQLAEGSTRLTGISCGSATGCFAIGTDELFLDRTLALHWNGLSWKIVPTPNHSAGTLNRLEAVSCRGATNCFAVGSWEDPNTSDSAKSLIERWNGSSWTIVASPNVAPTDRLTGVSCPSATSCYAVGTINFGKTLVERWNGSAWSIVASANSSTGSVFSGISCATPTSCFAVGSSASGTNQEHRVTLVEHSNGGAFSIQPSPNAPVTTDNSLRGITCASATRCVAVGSSNEESFPRTLIERYGCRKPSQLR